MIISCFFLYGVLTEEKTNAVTGVVPFQFCIIFTPKVCILVSFERVLQVTVFVLFLKVCNCDFVSGFSVLLLYI